MAKNVKYNFSYEETIVELTVIHNKVPGELHKEQKCGKEALIKISN